MSTDVRKDNIMNVDTVTMDDARSALVIIDQPAPGRGAHPVLTEQGHLGSHLAEGAAPPSARPSA